MGYAVLVVDDSAFMRKSITQIIERSSKFEVIATARNGDDAIEKAKRLRPAVITLDVEMPQTDGLTAVERIMSECPTPIVMVSSLTSSGTDATVRALQLGAIDCVHKDSLLNHATNQTYADFYATLETAVMAKLRHRKSLVRTEVTPPRQTPVVTSGRKAGSVDAIVIGSSTGGPAALQSILPYLPEDMNVPVVVAQHMPAGFTKSLAERFDTICKVRVKEAEDSERPERGTVYIAPAGTQTLFVRHGADIRFQLTQTIAIDTRFRPSVDVTLLSAAPIFRDRLLTIILTGMGNDGTLGCQVVKEYNGRVLVQSEETCVVYGMPKSVYEAGFADAHVDLKQMPEHIDHYLKVSSKTTTG